MSSSSRTIYALSFILAAGGFLLPLWPLCVAGILLAALTGRWFFAILVGLLIDLAWGAPTGTLSHYAYVPFTLLALVAALLQRFGIGYFLDRTRRDTI